MIACTSTSLAQIAFGEDGNYSNETERVKRQEANAVQRKAEADALGLDSSGCDLKYASVSERPNGYQCVARGTRNELLVWCKATGVKAAPRPFPFPRVFQARTDIPFDTQVAQNKADREAARETADSACPKLLPNNFQGDRQSRVQPGAQPNVQGTSSADGREYEPIEDCLASRNGHDQSGEISSITNRCNRSLEAIWIDTKGGQNSVTISPGHSYTGGDPVKLLWACEKNDSIKITGRMAVCLR